MHRRTDRSPWPSFRCRSSCLADALRAPRRPRRPSEFLEAAGRRRQDAGRLQADQPRTSSALEKASPRVKIEVLGKSTLGEDMIMAVISSEENTEEHQDASRRRPGSSPTRAGSTDADIDSARQGGQGRPARHVQHPRVRDRLHADGDGVGARARDLGRPGDEAAARQRRPAARSVAEPRRPDHGDGVVPQEPRNEVRGQAPSVALPPLRRPRQQPRLVPAHPERDRRR